MEKRKLEADRKFINSLLGIEPLDWSRRDNNDLVYLDQSGRKFVLSQAEITAIMYRSRIQELVPKAKAILEKDKKSRSYHKNADAELESELVPEPKSVKELTEKQSPYTVDEVQPEI